MALDPRADLSLFYPRTRSSNDNFQEEETYRLRQPLEDRGDKIIEILKDNRSLRF